MKKFMMMVVAGIVVACFAMSCGDDEEEAADACTELGNKTADFYSSYCKEHTDCAVCTAMKDAADADAEGEAEACDDAAKTAAQDVLDDWDKYEKDVLMLSVASCEDAAEGTEGTDADGTDEGTDTE